MMSCCRILMALVSSVLLVIGQAQDSVDYTNPKFAPKIPPTPEVPSFEYAFEAYTPSAPEFPEAPSSPSPPEYQVQEEEQNENATDAKNENEEEDKEGKEQASQKVAESQSYLPYPNLMGFARQPYPSYSPLYQYNDAPAYPQYRSAYGDYAQKTTVEGESSYYRLDSCEYRFILDMVQCHEEEHTEEKLSVHKSGHQTHATNNYAGSAHYPGRSSAYPYHHNYPYNKDNQYSDFYRLYGKPSAYSGATYRPGYHDNSLFTYRPSVGHPFYAPGLHNQPFANYYAGFRAGKYDQSDKFERRVYHKEGHYRSAVQDFNSLKLMNVVNVTVENEASVKTSTRFSTSGVQGYEGVTPYFSYSVRLMPDHCSLAGYPGKHTCIVFTGATHPYKKIQRQFVYVTKSREVKNNYRFRYENQQRAQQQYPYHY